MRFKIFTKPPLPDLKAWFAVESNEGIKTILELKDDLFARLQPLQQCRSKHGICLDMDNFELLDSSPISILRDGDLIRIAFNPVSERPPVEDHAGLKHQRVVRNTRSKSSTRKRKRHQSSPPESPVSSSSSESSTSSASSSSPSDSSSDSSSDSDSSADSSLESDSESEISTPHLTSRAKPEPKPPVTHTFPDASIGSSKEGAPNNTASPPVPPGYGKPSTRNRNMRRRRKRQYEREPQIDESAPSGTSAANAIALGGGVETNEETNDMVEEDVDPSTSSVAPELMMLSFRNKNKKKGFKQSISKPLPPKIVFDTMSGAATSAPTIGQCISSDPSETPKLPHLIPPSERENLPSNLFVTSVDVEEGLKSKKKGKSRQKHEEMSWKRESIYEDQENIRLDYGNSHESVTSMIDTATPSAPLPCTTPVIALIEKRWSSLTKVVERSQLQPNKLFGWKALAINPRTCTPEMLLSVVQVLEANNEFKVQQLHGPEQISFGGTVDDENSGDLLQETYCWEDVMALEWKIIDI